MIGNIYNFYDGNSTVKKSSVHKPEELKLICSYIAKNNKNSSLYKYNISVPFAKNVVGVKEFGINIKNISDYDNFNFDESDYEYIRDFVKNYNETLENTDETISQRMSRTLHGIYSSSLKPVSEFGISYDESGKIIIDDTIFKDSFTENGQNISSAFCKFARELSSVSDSIIIDPVKYTDSPLLYYNNPKKPYAGNYPISLYSGLIFNYYT